MKSKQIRLILAMIISLSAEAQADVCRVCFPSPNYLSCTIAPLDCTSDIGCFSHTWVDEGVRYYAKGCQSSTFSICDGLYGAQCTLDHAIQCCGGDLCNEANLLTIWRPLQPADLVVVTVHKNSLILSWDPQCQQFYSYEVSYGLTKEGPFRITESNQSQIELFELTAGEYRFSVRSRYQAYVSNETAITRTILINDDSPTTSAAFPFWIIIVIIVGLVVVVLVIAFALWAWRRRRDRNKKVYNMDAIYAISTRSRPQTNESSPVTLRGNM